MKLHLNYTPPSSPKKIDHQQKILLTGSCFAENIGEYLNTFKFHCLVNPSGILFNPASILVSLDSILHNSELQPELLVQNEGTFYSLLHHGSFQSESREGILRQVHAVTEKAHRFLIETDWLIVSFGSAFVYRFTKTNNIVANCHKLPQNEFKKELLSPENIISDYTRFIKNLQLQNPKLKIVFTVSPVKYLRDGVVENNLSKSVLIQSVHEIIRLNQSCYYFPAYELVTDDLRDYRFYKEDLAHPNETAVNYVWEKFSECFFSRETANLNLTIGEIVDAANHRPLNPNSEAYAGFKRTYLRKCENLENQFRFLDLNKEKKKFTSL